MVDQNLLRKEIDKIENNLRRYAFNQSRRFFLKGDCESNGEDIYSEVYVKFFSRFDKKENEEEFVEIIENNILERYLKVCIRNKASDMRDLQEHAPTDLRANSVQNEEGDYIDPLDNIGDFNPNPDRIINYRKILDLLKEDLDELETLIIFHKFEKNNTFDKVSEILNINLNTLQTKVGQIRLKHSKYKDLNWDYNE